MTDRKSAVTPPVGTALSDIARRVSETRLPLRTRDSDFGRTLHGRLSTELDDFLLPRISRGEVPFIIAIGGSTGAGKSTLINSLIGREVSSSGVRRPTTSNPIIVHNPADADYFRAQTFLADLPRTADPSAGQTSLVLVEDDSVVAGTAVLDCPDIDSVASDNRALAHRVLMSADLWVFVTTANRYADAAPWALLKEASRRHTSVAIVLDRVPPEANREVRHHLSSLLSESGLANSPIFSVAEVPLEDGLLPHAAVFPISSWIREVGLDEDSRDRIRQRTLGGSIAALPPRLSALASHVETQESALNHLQSSLDEEFRRAHDGLRTAFTDGRVLRGEVNARWQDFVGTGQLFRGLEPSVARMRDRISAAVTGKRDAAAPLSIAIMRSAALTLREQAVAVVDAMNAGWQQEPAGTRLIDDRAELRQVSPDLEDSVKSAVTVWTNEVNALVRDIGQGKKSKARILSFGVAGVCAVLEYAAFRDGGSVDAVSEQARADSGVAHSLVATIFGEQEAAGIIESVRERFLTRAWDIVSGCRMPFDNVLALSAIPARQSGALRAAGGRLEAAL